jgi:transposase-like protein
MPNTRSADLGVGKSTLGKWIADRRPSVPSTVPQSDLALENERLRQENRVLREEREIQNKGPAVLRQGTAIQHIHLAPRINIA